MSTANDAVDFIKKNHHQFNLNWVNTGRQSENWKLKIFSQSATGPQLAIYNRKSILVLTEKKLPPLDGVTTRAHVPASGAAKIGLSHFSSVRGHCYSVETTDSLAGLICSYYSLDQRITDTDQAELALQFEKAVHKSLAISKAKREARLSSAPKKPLRIKIEVTAFDRNPDVVAAVLLRARGICEICESTAPFKSKSSGRPYLEVQHKTRLSDDGDDTVENAIAACPNCHREAHYG